MRIWKWTLALTDVQTLEMPVGAGILTVQTQGDMPQLWAICDEKATGKDKRHIAFFGTGNPMPDEPGEYISTFQVYDGALVFHAFEVDDERLNSGAMRGLEPTCESCRHSRSEPAGAQHELLKCSRYLHQSCRVERTEYGSCGPEAAHYEQGDKICLNHIAYLAST